jgi:hypothetical protein
VWFAVEHVGRKESEYEYRVPYTRTYLHTHTSTKNRPSIEISMQSQPTKNSLSDCEVIHPRKQSPPWNPTTVTLCLSPTLFILPLIGSIRKWRITNIRTHPMADEDGTAAADVDIRRPTTTTTTTILTIPIYQPSDTVVVVGECSNK